jgi:hypothetical protein
MKLSSFVSAPGPMVKLVRLPVIVLAIKLPTTRPADRRVVVPRPTLRIPLLADHVDTLSVGCHRACGIFCSLSTMPLN